MINRGLDYADEKMKLDYLTTDTIQKWNIREKKKT